MAMDWIGGSNIQIGAWLERILAALTRQPRSNSFGKLQKNHSFSSMAYIFPFLLVYLDGII